MEREEQIEENYLEDEAKLEQIDMKVLKEIVDFIKEILGTSREEAQAIAMKILANPDSKQIKYVSNVSPEEASAMAEELVISKRYRYAKHVADYTIEELFLRCSVQGWRGRQLENMVIEGQKAEKVGFFGRFLRRFKRKGEEIGIENVRLE